MTKRRKRWAYSAGEKPNTVTVYERRSGGALYVRVWDPTARDGRGNWIRRSLGHSDRERAKAYALKEAGKLAEGDAALATGRATLGQVFALYERFRTPRKGEREQTADTRRIEMCTRVLGAGKDPHTISLRAWETFIDARRSGAIDARGRPVAPDKRRPVRARTVEADCDWLRWVFNWASRWRLGDGRYLMRENPVRGFEAPTEKNPRRPVASADRFEALRAVSDRVTMTVQWGGKPETRRSHLSELLELVNGTGRRISAVCALRYDDLRLERTESRPYGAIRWPEDTDKEDREWVSPIGPRVLGAIDRVLRERPGLGAAPLFPSPGDPEKPVSRHLADTWLREAEREGGIEPQRGSLWHAYRRKWATERKHLPDVDVAAAGGWKDTTALKRAYQQADESTMLEVVLGAGELRKAR